MNPVTGVGRPQTAMESGSAATISPAAYAATNASAIAGSNCDPEHRSTSATAPSNARASQYGLEEVIASNESATASSLPSSGISMPGAPRRVATAVPALVVEQHVRQGRRERRDPCDQPGALDRVGAHLGELGVVEPSRLAENVGANVHLADVVQRGAEPKLLERGVLPAEPPSHCFGVQAYPRGVALERGVANAHRGGEDREPGHVR